MARLKFKVHMDGLKSLEKELLGRVDRASHAVAAQAHKDTSPYVPMLTGSLDQRSYVDGNQIIYPGPYARYLYNGKLMVDPETGSSYAKEGANKILTDKNLVFNKASHAQAQDHWFEAAKAQNLEKWIRYAGKVVTKYGGK